MSFFKKTPVPAPKPEPVVPEEPVFVPEPVKAPEPEKFVPIKKTTIGKGITFVGNFETKDPMELNGSILGDVASTELIEVSTTGSYKGNASMKNLVLSGDADGIVECEDLTKLTSTAKMTGKLTTARLVTDDGSSFIGDMKLEKKAAAAPAPQYEPAPAPAAYTTEAVGAEADAFARAEKAAEEAANEFEALRLASEKLERDLADADGDSEA